VLVVHPSLPARSVKELIALARAKPNELNFGSSGIGSASHLAAELFQSMAQVKFVHVPFKGQGLAMIDLLGGHMQLGFPSVPASIQHIKSGKMIALAVATKQRSSALPDVSTMSEAGLTGYEVSGWYGLVGPAKLPKAVVAKLNAELNRMLQDAATREILAREGADPLPGTPDEFANTLSSDIVKWAKVVKAAGIKVE
jgi:tripartite-type tricarboxylate transporter receptor subunit TctC